jgi:hypothetical protein
VTYIVLPLLRTLHETQYYILKKKACLTATRTKPTRTLSRGSTNFPPTHSWRQKSGMKQIPYWGPTILKCSLNLTAVWRFLYGTRAFIYIFVCMLKTLDATVHNLVPRKLCTSDLKCFIWDSFRWRTKYKQRVFNCTRWYLWGDSPR